MEHQVLVEESFVNLNFKKLFKGEEQKEKITKFTWKSRWLRDRYQVLYISLIHLLVYGLLFLQLLIRSDGFNLIFVPILYGLLIWTFALLSAALRLHRGIFLFTALNVLLILLIFGYSTYMLLMISGQNNANLTEATVVMAIVDVVCLLDLIPTLYVQKLVRNGK